MEYNADICESFKRQTTTGDLNDKSHAQGRN